VASTQWEERPLSEREHERQLTQEEREVADEVEGGISRFYSAGRRERSDVGGEAQHGGKMARWADQLKRITIKTAPRVLRGTHRKPKGAPDGREDVDDIFRGSVKGQEGRFEKRGENRIAGVHVLVRSR